MTLRLLLCGIVLFIISNGSAQVGIGTTSPNSSSMLDIESNEKGVLIPRMTAMERLAITTPAEGLMVYQSDDVIGFYFFDGTSWDRILKESKDPVPTGAIFSFPIETPPTGYLICDGSAISRTTYADLFALLGTTYGAGDGSTTFNLPDYRGRFLRGHDNGAGNDPDASARLDRGDGTTGDAVGTIQDHDMESHLHQIDPPGTLTNYAGNHSHNTNSTTISTFGGGNHSHSTNTTSTTTQFAGNHRHRVRGEEISISGNVFGSDDFAVDDNGTSGPDILFTSYEGNHTHNVNIPSLTTNTRGNHNHDVNIPSLTTYDSGSHYHVTDISVFDSAATGTNENRPINITVIYCIKY